MELIQLDVEHKGTISYVCDTSKHHLEVKRVGRAQPAAGSGPRWQGWSKGSYTQQATSGTPGEPEANTGQRSGERKPGSDPTLAVAATAQACGAWPCRCELVE